MELLHTINLTGAKVALDNVDLNDQKKRGSLIQRTPTLTLPFLQTCNGNISESKAIEYFLCSKYKPELLGNSVFEKAQINQWIEFACCEIKRSVESLIYPIFGWAKYCKEKADKENENIKKYLKIIENNLNKNKFVAGNKLSLADVVLFRYLRFFFMMQFPEGMRKKLFPQTTKWFEQIMNSKEAVSAYGKTILCKNPIKAFTGEIKRCYLPEKKECQKTEECQKCDDKKEEPKETPKEQNEGKGGKKNKKNKNKNENKESDKKEEPKETQEGEDNKKGGKKDKKNKKKENKKDDANKKDKKNKKEEKKEQKIEVVKEIKKVPYEPSMLETDRFKLKKKENNPLDALPPSKFDLEKFKKEFLANTDKKTAMDNFWKEYDSDGYSLWHIEYNNEPSECITLFRTVVIKGDILLQLEYFKKYCFGVLGVYGGDGDYKISGCMVWRGQEIPDEMKDVLCYNKLKFRKLNNKEQSDLQLVNDYWTKINETDKVLERQAIDTRYFY